MVRKSKRKHVVQAFEKSEHPAPVDFSKFSTIVEEGSGSSNGVVVLGIIKLIASSPSLSQQIRIIQDSKKVLKEVTTREYCEDDREENIEGITLLLHVFLEPSHMWLRKYLEWISEAICKSRCLPHRELRNCIRNTCMSVLHQCVESRDFESGSLDRCFEWVYTFQWMVNLDKEIAWMDDITCEEGTGYWESATWPAGRELGEGGLLLFLQAMTPLVVRCSKTVCESGGSDTFGQQRSAAEVLRYAECVGESLRVLSAALKPRRGAIIPSLPHLPKENEDPWKQVTDVMLTHTCQMITSEALSKDALTSTALAIVNIQWLLRERLWECARRRYRYLSVGGESHLTVVNIDKTSSFSDIEWQDASSCAGLQLVALLGLLQQPPAVDSPRATLNVLLNQSASLILPFALAVGISPVVVSALGPQTSTLPQLSRCALFRACLSVFDASALMYCPMRNNFSSTTTSRSMRDLLSFLQLLGEAQKEYGEEKSRSVHEGLNVEDLEQIAAQCVTEISSAKDWIAVAGATSTPFSLDGNEYHSSGLLFGAMFDMTASLCFDSVTPAVRVYGLQTLETWLGRVDVDHYSKVAAGGGVTSMSGVAEKLLRGNLVSRLCIVDFLLTKAWSHPSKLVNHMVPMAYQRVLDIAHKLDTEIKSRDAVGIPDHDDIWGPFVRNALSQPVQYRGRYQALSYLLPKVGGEHLLQLHPQIFRSLVMSMRVRDVASAVGSFMGSLLRSLLKDKLRKISDIRKMYIHHVACGLCSPEVKLRTNCADHIIPEILSIDLDSGPILINEIRELTAVDDQPVSSMSKLWGIISITLHARLLSKNGADIVETNEIKNTSHVMENKKGNRSTSWLPLTARELESACLCNDVEIRLTGLTVLTACQRTLAPIPPLELRILRKTLPYSLKSPVADVRQKIVRVLRTLVTRLRESYRTSVRDGKKLLSRRQYDAREAAGESTSAASSFDNMTGTDLVIFILADTSAKEEETACAEVIKNVLNTLEWLSRVILANIYPGAPNDREIMALEMLRCVFTSITGELGTGIAKKTKNSHAAVPLDPELNAALLSIFCTEQMTYSILNLLISSWDRTRSLAAELLNALPKPLPGYETPEKVTSLWRLGCKLVGSARQRESDSGALILRVVMSIFSLQLNWEIQRDSTTEYDEKLEMDISERYGMVWPAKSITTPVSEKNPYSGRKESLVFIESLCDILDSRLFHVSKSFELLCGNKDAILSGAFVMPSSLAHGTVLAIRYCIEDAHASGILPSATSNDACQGKRKGKSSRDTIPLVADDMAERWKDVVKRTLQLSLASLKAAMQIVADAPVDTMFAPMPFDCKSSSKKDTRGYASDSFMLNTNVFMDLDVGAEGEGGPDDDSFGKKMQHAVIGAWLLVKESCALIAKLVEISPAPCESAGNEHSVLLTTNEISNVGSVLLDALARLKHNGAIAETQTALQSVCQSVLSCSSSRALSQLPSIWLDSLFERLRGEHQVFILRRSAGFAFSFISLLRSEPKNCKPTLLPLAMQFLFEHASKGLGQEDGNDALEGNGWRSVVHSLNILRLIILDSTLGPDLFPYIPQTTKIAVKGFKSPMWAIRNSSMMVFSAVVQRTVDNDKKESGGMRAATPADFFQRYPSLFPFVLSELSDIVRANLEMDSRGWPVNISVVVSTRQPPEQTHPSLYPLLLMLSKMRTSTLESSPPDASNARKDSGGGSDILESTFTDVQCDISLFIPLIQMCSSQQLYHVRTMAAKALSSLVPLQQVPLQVASIMERLSKSFVAVKKNAISRRRGIHGGNCDGFSSNILHGMLLQAYNLTWNLQRLIVGDSADMGDNELYFSRIVDDISKLVVPQLLHLQQAMVSFAGSMENEGLVLNGVSLTFPYPPSVILTFERLVRVVHKMVPNEITTELLVKVCEMGIAELLDGMNVKVGAGHDVFCVPMLPLLWKECLEDLVDATFSYVLNGKNGMDSHAGVDSDESPTKPLAGLDMIPLCHLLSLVDHPISEVREGILRGCLRAFNTLTSGINTSPSAHTICAKVRDYIYASRTGTETEATAGNIIDVLLRRCMQEAEPPILEVTLELLSSITLWVPFSALEDLQTKENCLDSVSVLLQIACGTYSPDTMLDFLDPTVHSSATLVSCVATNVEREGDIRVAPTTSASFALQVLGWMVRSFFTMSLSLVQEKNSNMAEILSTNVPLGRLRNEQESVLSNNRDERLPSCGSDTEAIGSAADDVVCSSNHVWSWLRLMELAGAGEGAELDARGAAARCLSTSGALQWAAFNSVLGTQRINDIDDSCFGSSDFSCRVWILALHLMQDDDSDIRCWVNSAVSEAIDLVFKLQPSLRYVKNIQLGTLPCSSQTISELIAFSEMNNESQADNYRVVDIYEDAYSCGAVEIEFDSVQGLALERLTIPLSLAITWSLLLTQVKSDDDVLRSDRSVDELLTIRSGGILPVCLSGVVAAWTETCGVFSTATLVCESEQRIVQSLDVPEKIFEADQSNLFEERVVQSNALSLAMSLSVSLLPIHRTSTVWATIFRTALCAMKVIECTTSDDENSTVASPGGWIGGFTYYSDQFLDFHCALSGAASLCKISRQRDSLDNLKHPSFRTRENDMSERSAVNDFHAAVSSLQDYARRILTRISLKSNALNVKESSECGDTTPSNCSQSMTIHPLIIKNLVDIIGPTDTKKHEAQSSSCLVV